MKIVCDSCGAKYSIADEKVAGKVFKIRCKKCGAIIVVRGDQIAAEEQPAEETPSYDQGADAIWHVVVQGDQQGPFEPSHIGEMLTAGTIDWDAYVWREGFDNWLAARDVGELVEAVTGQAQEEQPAAEAYPGEAHGHEEPHHAESQPPAEQAPAEAAAPADSFPPEDQGMGADPFAAADPAATGEGLFGGLDAGQEASRARLDAGADLFAQSDLGSSPFEGGGAGSEEDVVASPSPRVSAEQAAMTGQRNENSVLFSLSNLQALATGTGAGSTPPAALAASPAGQATGEGSGLIDIKALAGAGPASGAPPAGEAVDDLLSIGTGSPMSTGLGAPVLAPVQEEKSNRGLMMALMGAGAFLGIALIVVAIIFITKDPEPVVQAAGGPVATGAITPPSDETTTPEASDEAPTEVDEAPEPVGVAAEPAEEPSEAGEPEGGSDPGRTRRRRGGRSSGSSMSSDTTAPAEAPAAPPTMRARGGDLDSLLDQALSGGGNMRATPMREASTGSSANLPATPPRDAVLRALRSVQSAVTACGQGQHGVAEAAIVVSGSTGRVTSANVSGQFAGTPVGSCVARAVRRARFPRFSQSTFNVRFPYRL